MERRRAKVWIAGASIFCFGVLRGGARLGASPVPSSMHYCGVVGGRGVFVGFARETDGRGGIWRDGLLENWDMYGVRGGYQ